MCVNTGYTFYTKYSSSEMIDTERLGILCLLLLIKSLFRSHVNGLDRSYNLTGVVDLFDKSMIYEY